ncbi:MAG: hypothetical protein IJH39_11445 [Clostridia bacterium]|nr:hypothetical protein [Clostridia bacterium]
MDENSSNTENLKKETVETVNDLKETIKSVDIKRDTVETKGFISYFYTKPLETIKEISEENSGKYFKYAIIILVIWSIAVLLTKSGILFFNIKWEFGYIFGDFLKNSLGVIKSLFEPILKIITMSFILLIFNKNRKKKLTSIISAVTTAYIPVAIAEVSKLLILISSDVTKITNPFSNLCSAITIILTYFAAKNVLEIEKHSDFIKKFILIEVCYYGIYFVLTFLGIYI